MTYNNWYHAMRRAQSAATAELYKAGVSPRQIRIVRVRVLEGFVEAFPEHREQYDLHCEMRTEDMRNP